MNADAAEVVAEAKIRLGLSTATTFFRTFGTLTVDHLGFSVSGQRRWRFGFFLTGALALDPCVEIWSR